MIISLNLQFQTRFLALEYFFYDQKMKINKTAEMKASFQINLDEKSKDKC